MIGQLSIAVVLLVGTGLLLRSLAQLISLDPGFDAGTTVVAEFDLSDIEYPRPKATAFIEDLRRRIGALPGVQSIGVGTTPRV